MVDVAKLDWAIRYTVVVEPIEIRREPADRYWSTPVAKVVAKNE